MTVSPFTVLDASQSHRPDLVNSDGYRENLADVTRACKSRNPTVLISSIPTMLDEWKEERRVASGHCRNPTVLIWSIPTLPRRAAGHAAAGSQRVAIPPS